MVVELDAYSIIPYRPLVPATGDVHFVFLPTALTLHKLGCGFGSSSI